MATEKEYQEMLRSLTGKQRLFVKAYVATLNATKAAELAKYKGSNQTLRSVGSENLSKPHIKAAIDAGLELHGIMSESELLSRLTLISKGDPSGYIKIRTITKRDNDGATWDEEQPYFDIQQFQADGLGILLKKLYYNSNGPVVELHDPVRCMELLGKYHKTWTEKHEIQDRVTVIWDMPEITEDDKPEPDWE